MLDTPTTGRIFFEQVIRDNLDLGRPDHVGLVFGRRIFAGGPRPTPGRFRTRIITSGVTPSLHVDYKHATIKQYHKEGRALRTETTINDPGDFNIRKRLTNLPAMRKVGCTASRRLLPRRTPQPRPRHRSRRVHRHHRAHRRRRPTRRRTALRRPPRPGPAGRPPGLPATTRRVHQRRPAHPPHPAARYRPRRLAGRPRQLRPAPATAARPDRTHPKQPPLPGHRHRPAPRHVPHPSPQQTPPNRNRSTHRPRPARAHSATRGRPHLRRRPRRTHPPSRPRRLKLDPIKTTSSSKAL